MNRQQTIAENPPQAFRINSIGDKNQQKTAAQKALETAKKLNRPVRMAKPGESGSFRVEKPSEQPGFLDLAATAKKTGMSKATLSLRLKYGLITGTMMNRKWFFAEKEVERFIESMNK